MTRGLWLVLVLMIAGCSDSSGPAVDTSLFGVYRLVAVSGEPLPPVGPCVEAESGVLRDGLLSLRAQNRFSLYLDNGTVCPPDPEDDVNVTGGTYRAEGARIAYRVEPTGTIFVGDVSPALCPQSGGRSGVTFENFRGTLTFCPVAEA